MRRRFRRFFRRLLERLLDRHREGPEPPARFAEQARLFLLLHPNASTEEWEAFAARLAEVAYREAFVRGLEIKALDTDDDNVRRLEIAADEERHEWSLREASEATARLLEGDIEGDLLAGVPPHERAEAYDRLGEMLGTHRAVLLDTSKTP